MTPQELKNSILQLAIQGKLVKQRQEEGTGEELYNQIQIEKQKLINAGTIKKEKPLPEITEDEKPFDIPESWIFVRLDNMIRKNIKRGKSPTYIASSDTLVFAQKCNVKTGEINMALAQFLDESTLGKYPKEEFISHMDIIVNSTGNGTLGRVGLFRDSDNPTNHKIAPDSHVTVIRVSLNTFPLYAFYYLKSCQPYLESMGGGSTNQTELKPDVLRALVVPLPPLAEQKRIVAKIEELMPYIDRYEKAWSKLEDFNKRFPGDMQKSILQTAIQGKLVEQRPEEGTGEELYQQIQAEKQKLIKAGTIKKEKPMSEITEDEKPFDIPESWRWCYVGDLFQHNTGKALNGTTGQGTMLSYITTSNLYWNKFELDKLKEMPFTDTEIEKCTVTKGDLLVIEGGFYFGRAAVWKFDYDMRIQNHIHRLRPYREVCIEFFYYLFYLFKQAGWIEYKGIGMQGLSSSAIHKIVFPLPPLAEQKRIVAKVEELLPLCEKLK